LRNNQARLPEAEQFYTRSLAARRQALAPDDPLIADSLLRIGGVRRRLKNYAGAEESIAEALALRERKFGAGRGQNGNALHFRAHLRENQKQDSEAEADYERVVALEEKDNPLEAANALWDLASLYLRQERYEPQEKSLLKLIALREAALGADHPSLAESF